MKLAPCWRFIGALVNAEPLLAGTHNAGHVPAWHLDKAVPGMQQKATNGLNVCYNSLRPPELAST
eukprot:1153089-Pelagomonas_calceolata.AAC.3